MKKSISRRALLQAAAVSVGAIGTAEWVWLANRSPLQANAANTLASTGPLDTIVFGNATSESAHSLTTTLSSTVTGGLSQMARVFNPSSPASVWGGTASFTIKCDPKQPTYISIKLWGSDVGSALGRLMLFCEGKQVGYYHLGDVDPLDIAWDQPRTVGRFFYHTLPLPQSMTQGKTTVNIGINSMGRIWGYGTTAAQYYYPLVQPSRGVYRVYSHLTPFFTPASDDVQGTAPNPAVRTSPGSEVMASVSTRVTSIVNSLLAATPSSLDLWSLVTLAKAYFIPSTPAYNNNQVLSQVIGGLDALYTSYLASSTVLTASPQQWQGFGRVGQIMVLLASQLSSQLSQDVTGITGTTRLTAYTKMLVDSCDYWRQHLPQYSNQMMICSLGVYQANRGLSVIAPGKALPESTARTYIYQAVGLLPWLGPEDASGTPTKPLGSTYYEVTRKGLTRELGYVGDYGEVIDWLCFLWEAVTEAGGVKDTTLQKQIIKIIKARAVFRYPEPDANGNRAMRMETVIGWRDVAYPGEVVYVQRSSVDGDALRTTVIFQDPALIGYSQQMMADNQYYTLVQSQISNHASRNNLNVLSMPGDYSTFLTLPTSSTRLPMTDGQPDFVFTDEENGAVALKNGQERLYASLYWRARWGINNLARIHHITPTIDRSATVWEQTAFTSTGKVYTQPDWINEDFGNGGITPPGPTLHQAFAGTSYPVASSPSDVIPAPVGTESPFAGRASFYQCTYGRYVIAMNASSSQSHAITVPQAVGTATLDLVSRQVYASGSTVTLAPLTTIVWDLDVASQITYSRIVSHHSGKVLGIANNSTSAGAAVLQQSDNGGTSQQWSLVSVGSGYSKLVNRNSGKVLGIANNSTSAGGVAQQQSDSGSTSQQWSLVSVGNGYSKLVNHNSGKVLDVANNSTSDGAVVQQWSDNGGTNQQWSLVATS
jgi:hypothetical protein